MAMPFVQVYIPGIQHLTSDCTFKTSCVLLGIVHLVMHLQLCINGMFNLLCTSFVIPSN